MCECGCGDTNVQKAFQLPDKTVLGYQLYSGCEECFQGPGINLYLFDPKGAKEWVSPWVKREKITPDEYGGNEGAGIAFGLFEIRDLQSAAEELEAQKAIEDYEGEFSEWLNDEGLRWIQLALAKFKERTEAEEAERKARKKVRRNA